MMDTMQMWARKTNIVMVSMSLQVQEKVITIMTSTNSVMALHQKMKRIHDINLPREISCQLSQ